jgi:hypothetical protein
VQGLTKAEPIYPVFDHDLINRILNGPQPYAPSQPTTSGVIAAIHPQVCSDVRAVYEAVRMPLQTGLPRT